MPDILQAADCKIFVHFKNFTQINPNLPKKEETKFQNKEKNKAGKK